MAAALILGLAILGGPAAACPWPASLDAVAAAPGNHRVVLENDRVRVLDVTVAPGEREPLHAHCFPSVMYLMQEGVYRDYDAAGRLVEEVSVAPPAAQFPMTLWLEPQAPHSVHNLDPRPTRLLRIEFKDTGAPAAVDAESEIRRLEQVEWSRAVRVDPPGRPLAARLVAQQPRPDAFEIARNSALVEPFIRVIERARPSR